jgi:hypothetical protein
MKFVKKEYHQVISYFNYDFDEEELAKVFGSVERFLEIATHESDDIESEGEEPTDEERDTFIDFINDADYERDDDWWTDRKGGYEVNFELGEENE